MGDREYSRVDITDQYSLVDKRIQIIECANAGLLWPSLLSAHQGLHSQNDPCLLGIWVPQNMQTRDWAHWRQLILG